MFCAIAGTAAGGNLASLSDERFQPLSVFVIQGFSLICAQAAEFLPGH
jgi:hypothetical protein